MGWAIFAEAFGTPHAVALRYLTVRHCLSLRNQGFYISMGAVRQSHLTIEGTTLTHNSHNAIYHCGAHFDITGCVLVYAYPWEFHANGTTEVLAGGLNLTGPVTGRNKVMGNEFGWPGDYPNCADGCGYDFEGSNADVTFQDNFIHDSYGEAVLFMGNMKQTNLLFDGNIFHNNVRFGSYWKYDVSLPASVSGNGTFRNNKFFSRPGKRAFDTKPGCFTFSNNEENATGTFAPMPMVSRIQRRDGVRLYTLAGTPDGATIRYTLDGSLPTAASPIYEKPIEMRRSGIINAKAFKDGAYSSYVNSLAVEMRNAEQPDPVARWKLDECSGNRFADTAGENHGELAREIHGTSRKDRGVAFNGTNDLLTIKQVNLAGIADTFTVAFWAEAATARTATPEIGDGCAVPGAAWWKMNEGFGHAIADSNAGRWGVFAKGTWTEGKFGKALWFDGKNDLVHLQNEGLKSLTDNFTISFWAVPEASRATTPEATHGVTGVADQRYAVSPAQYGTDSGEAGVGISVGTNGASVFELAGNHKPSLLVADRPLQGWNLITLVCRDKQPSLYINGELVKTGLKSTKTIHADFSLGGGGVCCYQGKLADLRVFPRALADSEVRQLSRDGAAATVPWSLDPRAGTKGLPYALCPASRGGGPDTRHAGMGVALGTNGVTVCEASDNYLPSVLVANEPLMGWNHITVVYLHGQPTLYLNGVYVKAGYKSQHTVHPVFNLGGGAGLGFFGGKLDDVRIYDRALTDAEVQVLASGN